LKKGQDDKSKDKEKQSDKKEDNTKESTDKKENKPVDGDDKEDKKKEKTEKKDQKLLRKVNKSTQFLAHFYMKISKNEDYKAAIIKIKKNCVSAGKSKVFTHMDARVRESRINVAKLLGLSKNGEKPEKNRNLIRVTVLRLFKEYFVNMISCDFIYKKKTLKSLKDLIKAINDSIWNRCKKNCELFEMKSLLDEFNELMNRELKDINKGSKRKDVAEIIAKNVSILVDLYTKFKANSKKDAKNSKKEKKSDNTEKAATKDTKSTKSDNTEKAAARKDTKKSTESK